MTGTEGLQILFAPRSIAVIGASSTRGKNGNTVVRNLLQSGYGGRVISVNASGAEVEGLPSVRAIGEAEGPVDCAIVMIPAQDVVRTVRECAAANVRAAVIGAAGFAEAGTPDGTRWQDELSAIARESGMRVLGPNTNGFYNASANLPLGYNGAHGMTLPRAPVSILSHSGALFGGIARCLGTFGSGLEKFVSVGNEADVGLLDLFEMLIDDAATEVIGLVVESLSDGRRFRALAGRARAVGKPVVVLKIGRSAVGAEASLAHSSRLAGSARAYDALFAVAGVATVPSPEALAGACALLVGAPPRAAGGILCVTTSGAGGALLADHAADRGLPLAGDRGGAWTGDLAKAMAALPAGGAPRNPVDVGALRDWSRLGPIFDELAAGGIDGPTAVFAHIAPRPGQDEMLAETLSVRRRATRSPVALAATGGLRPETEALYQSMGIPVFPDIGTAMDGLAAWSRIAAAPPDEAPMERPLGTAARLPRGRSFLDEKESGDLLRAASVPVVETRTASTPEAAAVAAEDLGFPVVLKALAPGVMHKHREGHVTLGLTDAAAVQRAATRMVERVAGQGHDPSAVPLILQRMRQGRLELIVGASEEPPLGRFLVIGLGGVNAEALDRTLLLPVPMSREAIGRRLDESWLAPMLDMAAAGARTEMADLLATLQDFVLAHGSAIHSIDLNPVLVGEEGCVAVDAAIVLSDTTDPTDKDQE